MLKAIKIRLYPSEDQSRMNHRYMMKNDTIKK